MHTNMYLNQKKRDCQFKQLHSSKSHRTGQPGIVPNIQVSADKCIPLVHGEHALIFCLVLRLSLVHIKSRLLHLLEQ